MTSRASLLNFTLIKENFKRFWPIMAGGLAFWLICGPIALMISRSNGGYDYSVMKSVLTHLNPAPIMLNILLPVALAVACFSYLQKSNSAGVMHAMPFSRASLFVSNYVSGLVLAILPAAVITVFLLLMRGGVEIPTWDWSPTYVTGTRILRFLLEEFTVVSFVYSIAVFAAVISGLGVIHALTAVALNFICPAVFLLMMGYMDIYEYGFTAGSLFEEFAMRMNPYMQILGGDGLSFTEVIVYLIVAAVIALLAFLLYRARYLEKAGESYVFRAAKYIIGFLMVLFASSLTGFIFHSEIGPAAYILGFVVGYIVSMMIINKSTKIFTKDCLLSGLIYALVIAAIVCVFRFDAIGYQKRVPDASRVESVEFWSSTVDLGMDGKYDTIEDPVNIEHVTNFHREIVSDKKNYLRDNYYFGSGDFDSHDATAGVTLRYALKNGRRVERTYTIPMSLLRKSEDMKAVWNSAENNGLLQSLDPFSAGNTEITLEGYTFDDNFNGATTWQNYDTDNLPMGTARLEEKQLLIEALKKDVRNIEYDSLFADYDYEPYINISLDCRIPVDPHEPEEYIDGAAWNYYDYNDKGEPIYNHIVLNINARKNYVNTMNALLQMDISGDLRTCVETILAR
ncbi:MAG: hypothetical protein J5555_04555 [Firmicutes bacterium]|nr:hypothetical protein [Bacillota bacterium]